MSNEEWKDLPEYEGLYKVSNLGRVKNNKGKIKSLRADRYGYLRTNISKNGAKTYIKIHRIVAQLFVDNPNPSLYTEVDHIKPDKDNNCADNLRWVTPDKNKKTYWTKQRYEK